MRTLYHGNVRIQKLPKFITINASGDDNTCELIHEKCHHKSYHSDIKYYVTLKYNIWCSIPYFTGGCSSKFGTFSPIRNMNLL